MLIAQIELEDFKSYAHAVIPVAPGTNAIVGANGAGKSSLLEAVGLCLFDATPPGYTFANMLREGARSGRIVVSILSSADERLYEVERGFNERATTRYRVYDVELNRAVVADGKEDVLAWMRQHLQMEPTAKLDDFFGNTIGVPQGTFTAPFLQTASARKPIFDSLLQVDDYRKAGDGLRPAAQLLDQQHRALSEEIARAEGQLQALPDLEAEIEELTAAIAELAAQEQAALEALRVAEQALQAHEAAEKALAELVRRREAARAQASALAQRLEDARRALAEAQDAAVIVEETRVGHEAFLAAEAQLRELESRRHRRDALLAQQAELRRQQTAASIQHQQALQTLCDMDAAAEALQALAPQVERQARLEEAVRQAENDCAQRERSGREVESLAGQVREAEQEVDRLAAAVQRAGEIEARLATLQEELTAQRQAQRSAGERLAALTSASEQLEKQSAMLHDVEVARCPVCERELTSEHRDELLARNAERLGELEQERQAAQDALAAAEKAAAGLEAKSRRLDGERRGLAGEAELERARERLAAQQERYRDAVVAWQALADAPQRLTALQAELAALGDPRGQARLHEALLNRRPNTEAEAQRLERLLAELGESLAQMEADLGAYATLNDDLAQAQAEREAQRAAHERHLAHARLAEQVEDRRTRAAGLDEEHHQATATLAALDKAVCEAEARYDGEAHRLARQRTEALREQLAHARATRAAQETRQRAAAQQVAALRTVAKELEQKRAQQEETTALRGLLQRMRELLRQAGPHITRQLVHRISHEASALYADIMGDHSGRLHWSEDYDLSLEVRGNRRAFRQLSGGEQMCAALALRLALLREMSRIDIAFFDEPTTNLDSERREGLAERIMQVRGFEQLFVISHDDTFERAAQNYIRIVKDERGSRVETG